MCFKKDFHCSPKSTIEEEITMHEIPNNEITKSLITIPVYRVDVVWGDQFKINTSILTSIARLMYESSQGTTVIWFIYIGARTPYKILVLREAQTMDYLGIRGQRTRTRRGPDFGNH